MKSIKNKLSLYLVTDRSWEANKGLVKQVEEAIQSGVTFVQLREKKLDYPKTKELALKIQNVCNKYNVAFVINDNVQLAHEINADGVHIGQDDMDAITTRKIMKDKIVGVSVFTVEEALLAQENGADYLGVGTIFTTSTKKDAANVSINTLTKICDAVKIPVVAIGGINEDNLHKLENTNIDGVAIVSAILAADNIKSATLNLKTILNSIIKEKKT